MGVAKPGKVQIPRLKKDFMETKPELTPLKAWILNKHLQPDYEMLVKTCYRLGINNPEQQASEIMDTLAFAEKPPKLDSPVQVGRY
jgi:hypothetical protein